MKSLQTVLILGRARRPRRTAIGSSSAFLFLLLVLLVLLAAAPSPLRAADPTPPPAPKSDEAVLLSPFVVTEKSRGIIPLNGWFRYNRITGTVKTPVMIGGVIVSGQTLDQYGVKRAERIVAVNGQRIAGMDKSDLIRLWMETDDAGDPIKLTLQGSGENVTTFREVVLKRVPPPRKSDVGKPSPPSTSTPSAPSP